MTQRSQAGRFRGGSEGAPERSNAVRRIFSQLEAHEFAALLDLSSDAVLVLDLDGIIGFWNLGAERLYGWRSAEMVGKSAHTVLKTVFPTPLEKIKTLVHEEGEWRGDLTHTKRDGTTVVVSSRWTPRYSDADELIGTFEVNRDVTDERRAHEALMQVRNLDRLAGLGLLAASLAHEINNPLDAISGLVYLLQMEKSLSPQAAQHLAAVRHELDRVASVVRNTLSLSRQAPATVDWCDLGELLDSAVSVYAGRIRQSAIEVQRRYGKNVRCYCPASQMRQVMANLIGNALDAMTSGGVLRLRVHRTTVDSKPGYTVVVSDTGHGIPEETRERLFEPFYSTKGELGTGLGLWISQSLIHASGGRLRFRTHTAPPHGGTCFFMTVPEDTSVSTDLNATLPNTSPTQLREVS